MANIKPYVDAISQAVYGEEVRGAIINALIKVNDDNDAYQDLKHEVVDAKDKVEEAVAEFDGKVKDAEETERRLSGTTSTAKSAQTNLDNSIQAAGEAKSALEGSVESAGTAKRELDTSRESASGMNDTLKQTIQNAGNKDTQLSSTIDTAVMKNNELNGSITASEQKKTALDGSIETAEGKDTALKQSIKNAGTEKAALDKSRTDAETMKQNLDNSKSAADTSKQNLNKSIQDAGTANANLNNTVNTANTAKEELQEVVDSGNTVKTNLETDIQTAEQNASTLATRNATAEKNLADLKAAEGKASEILVGVEDIKAYLGYPDTDIVGIQVDYANKSFQRLAGAYGLLGGSDFDKFEMFGGRRRCNLANDGTINAFFGDEGYAEDGSNGQVMVYQPKFYYKVVPLVLEPISDGIGYHLRKANYYVSTKPKTGFKLHPAFYDESGAEIDHIFLSAFEGSVLDVSANAYLLHDEQVADFSNDLFCSISGARPASGSSQNLTRVNIEQMAKNRGAGWHGDTYKAEAANQLLMIIEMGTMNLQTAIGQGVVSLPWSTGSDSTSSYAAITGATSSLGNGTGRATTTTTYEGGVPVEYTVDGKTSVTYRGMENPWGNLWKFFYDVSFWGDGSLKGGVPYICKDFNFAENKKDGNYESAGFTLTNANGYISAVGYGNPDYDWLFFASECSGNSSLPVGDYTYISPNLNGFRLALLGGTWAYGGYAGSFCLHANAGVGARGRSIGGRLVYIPKAKAA